MACLNAVPWLCRCVSWLLLSSQACRQRLECWEAQVLLLLLLFLMLLLVLLLLVRLG